MCALWWFLPKPSNPILKALIVFFESGHLAIDGRIDPYPWLKQRVSTMSHYQNQHDARVKILAERMREAFIADDNGKFLACTGKLFRSTTLRTKKLREAFKHVLSAADDEVSENDQVQKRFWTKSVVNHALRKMVEQENLEVPQLPGFTWDKWFQDQAKLIHGLCKKAYRNRSYDSGCSGPAMDHLETLPYPYEDPIVFLVSSLVSDPNLKKQRIPKIDSYLSQNIQYVMYDFSNNSPLCRTVRAKLR